MIISAVHKVKFIEKNEKYTLLNISWVNQLESKIYWLRFIIEKLSLSAIKGCSTS